MRLLLWNWHTPYLALLARALAPDWQMAAQPTPHAPDGWRFDQRPLPENVELVAERQGFHNPPPDVVLCQNGADVQQSGVVPCRRLMLSHNRCEFDGTPFLRPVLERYAVPLVCISEMKAQSWRDAGWERPITVIPPGLPADDYGPWDGGGGYLLTVQNGIASRPLFDYDGWLRAVTQWAKYGGQVRLVGEGNTGVPYAVGPASSWDALRQEYRRADVYLCPTNWPHEDHYNLASLEAAASGLLVDSLHGKHPRISAFPFDAFARRWRQVLEEGVGP